MELFAILAMLLVLLTAFTFTGAVIISLFIVAWFLELAPWWLLAVLALWMVRPCRRRRECEDI